MSAGFDTDAGRDGDPGASRATLRVLVWLGLTSLLLAYLSQRRVIDVDVFHQMALFREALALGRIPREDVFAYTPTVNPVVHHEWGAGAILYGLWQATGWGPSGVSVLRYALIAGVLTFSYQCARRRGAAEPTIALLAPVALFFVTIGFFSPVRAHAFTLLFLSVLLLLLEIDKGGARWWIPVWLAVHVTWLNVHAGFVVGFAAVGAAAVERFVAVWIDSGEMRVSIRRVRHLVATMGAMALLVMANPYGWDYVSYLWRAIRMTRPHITEWSSLWDPRVSPMFLLLFAVSLSVLAYAVWEARIRAVLQTSGWLFGFVAAMAALLSVRHLALYALAWFTLVAPLVTPTGLGRWASRAWNRHRIALAGASLALVAIGAWKTVSTRSFQLTIPAGSGSEPYSYPVGAADYLSAHAFTGNVLTRFEDGSYVLWRLHPNVKVSLDSRYEAAYQPGVFEQHTRFFAGQPGWQTLLARYPTDGVLVPRTSPVGSLLEHATGREHAADWVRVYRDVAYSLYVRAPLASTLPMEDLAARR